MLEHSLPSLSPLIEKAFTLLKSLQNNNGSFSDSMGNKNVFYTALIGCCLAYADHSENAGIRQKSLRYIWQHKDRKSPIWQYNAQYPADLDDTFVALRAAYLSDSALVTEEILADITTLLINQEEKPGGPYQTWITKKKELWHDIDIVVNSNIAAFLGEFDIRPKPLIEYLDSCILQGNFYSKYYDHEIVVLYFLSQGYAGAYAGILRNAILHKRLTDGHWENVLHTAMAVSALLWLGTDPHELTAAIMFITNGIFDKAEDDTHLFLEYHSKDQTIYSACPAFVIACCIQALTLFQNSCFSVIIPTVGFEEEVFVRDIEKTCLELIGVEFSEQMRSALKQLATKDPLREVQLLPYRFGNALQKPISQQFIKNLAAANTLG
jgi:hypothetical protein